MGRYRIRITWLSLVTGVFWAIGGKTAAQDVSLQQRIAAQVPLAELTEPMRSHFRPVLENPTLFRHGPVEVFSGHPPLYHWLLEHPDRAVIAWRRLGAPCTEVFDCGQGWYGWKDGHGGQVRWQVVHRGAKLQIWYAEGSVRPAPFLPLVPVRAVLLLRHGERSQKDGRALIFHQADAFLQMDGKTAGVLTKMLGPSVPHLAEQCLGQLETFFSGIVWYLGQHPERTDTLLAAGNHEPAVRNQAKLTSDP